MFLMCLKSCPINSTILKTHRAIFYYTASQLWDIDGLCDLNSADAMCALWSDDTITFLIMFITSTDDLRFIAWVFIWALLWLHPWLDRLSDTDAAETYWLQPPVMHEIVIFWFPFSLRVCLSIWPTGNGRWERWSDLFTHGNMKFSLGEDSSDDWWSCTRTQR